jgi:hypothetical protein
MLGLEMANHVISEDPVAAEGDSLVSVSRVTKNITTDAPLFAIHHPQRLTMLSEAVLVVEAPDPAKEMG